MFTYYYTDYITRSHRVLTHERFSKSIHRANVHWDCGSRQWTMGTRIEKTPYTRGQRLYFDGQLSILLGIFVSLYIIIPAVDSYSIFRRYLRYYAMLSSATAYPHCRRGAHDDNNIYFIILCSARRI